ncbi:MAG: type II/IV secretion system protein [Deltaproteobacteria bacterium]|nr:MAG: type II/IV secretion system protein [Deltaproteobacteria bacterium]
MSIARHLNSDLADKLVTKGLLTKDQLAVARVSQQNLGEELGLILLKKGFLSEPLLLEFMGEELSVPYVSLSQVKIQSQLTQKIPMHVARRYHLMPLYMEGEKVVIAMTDPFDRFAMEDLKQSIGAEIKPVLSSMQEIDQCIAEAYGQSASKRAADSADVAMQLELVNLGGEDAGESGNLEKIATGPKVIQTVNQLIVQAFMDKASDIHIEPRQEGMRIRYRVDGLLEERGMLHREMVHPVSSRIKILGGLDIAERRAPQDGRVRIKIGGKPLDMRISTLPTLYGEKIVMRLLTKEGVASIESVGFSEKDRKTFADLIGKSHGIFLVTGPTGSGKSTTLYAALARINSPDKNIISVEDPVESEVAGVNQTQINAKAGVTFASALRSILRQDPDVIMIGEIRDGETGEIAVRAAITGHLVLSTLHTNSAAGAISRMNDLGVEHFLLSSALIGVLAQRLVRKICPECKVEEEPNPALVHIVGRPVKKSFRGQGCKVCRMSGYKGRAGIFELAPIDETVRKLISEKSPDHVIEEEFRKQGIQSLLDNGLEKVEQGMTTLEEVVRVTQEG